jgi:hypothetical protein
MRRALIAAALVCVLPCIATAQIAILQLKVIQGEGGVQRAGSRVARPLTVQVTDQTGKPVPDATVTFHLPNEEGPGGVFGNGLRTDVATTDAAGHATVGSIRLNAIAGPLEIRIIAVKGQVRAGMISLQYIAEAGSRSARTSSRLGRKKWILAALAVAGAAAALAIVSGGEGDSQPQPPVPGVRVGAPTITIGRP